jgi:RNA polymerase sigma factor (sigma-70 family)
MSACLESEQTLPVWMSRHYDIFERCKKNDPQAQRLLYDLFKGKLMGLCRRYATSREEAQDVLQESFVKIFTKINQLQTSDKLESWMKSVVVRTAIDHYHKQKNKELVFNRIDKEAFTVEDQLSSLQTVTDDFLIQVVNSLPAGCRMVFNLFAIEGYSHAEIAVILAVTEGTSRSQYHHAKMLLKEKLKSETLVEYYEKLA